MVLGVALSFVFLLSAGADAGSVSVTTDNSSYGVGDPIQVTIENNSGDRIARGGLDCDDLWPLALDQLDVDGNWQPVAVPQHNCIGITAALIFPGQTQSRTVSLVLDPGTYHVVYAFTDVDTQSQEVSASDPFDVS